VPIQALVGVEREDRFGTLLGIKRGQKPVGTLGHERCRRNSMGMDIVGVAIARAEHAHAKERSGRPEKRSSFHAEQFLPARLFCQLTYFALPSHLLRVAFLISAAAFFESASFAKPMTAEYFLPMAWATKKLRSAWSARLEMCQWRRERLDKESIWHEGRSTSLSRW
jgi:hypothetical protein